MSKVLQVQGKIFLWEGKTKAGNTISGEQVALNSAYVKAQLRRQGITPIKIRLKTKSLFTFTKGSKNIKPMDIAIFTRQLATMLGAGIPIVQAFDLVAKSQSNTKLQTIINSIKADVEQGSTFSDALSKHPKYFNDLYCNLVRAGEQSGSLEKLLESIATYKEKTESLRGKIKKAMFYPTAVIVVAAIVTTILLIFVVPQFESLFTGFGASLPAFTLFVIMLSKGLQSYWWLFLIGLVGIVVGVKTGIEKSYRFACEVDRLLLKIPIIGKILEKATIARFTRTLATTFAAGLPLVDALRSVAGATGNIIFQEATLKIRDEVSTGQTLTLSMQASKLFPGLVIQMVQIGEESGSLEKMLNKVSSFYEEEVDNAVDGLSNLLEPLIMAILGIVVGGLVIAMYLPIFKLGSVI